MGVLAKGEIDGIELWGIESVFVLANIAMVIYVLLMGLKTGVMGMEYIRKIRRGAYYIEIGAKPECQEGHSSGLQEGGGGGPQRRLMWTSALGGAGRVAYQAGRT